MSKFLSNLIQITSGSLGNKHIFVKMSKRSGFHRTPKFKPEVKVTNNRPKQTVTMTSRKEKVEVLPEPIKSVADKKLYKTIKLENGLTALLISDPSRQFVNDDNSSSEEESSGSDESSEIDSDGSKSGASVASDQHGTKRKAEFDEEKLCRYLTHVTAIISVDRDHNADVRFLNKNKQLRQVVVQHDHEIGGNLFRPSLNTWSSSLLSQRA